MNLKASISNLFLLILTKSLKPQTKRLLMLASLGANLCEKSEFDKNSTHKLNTVMSLSHRDDALKLPFLLRKVIWNGSKGSELLYSEDEREIQEATEKLLKDAPSWLRYSSEESMKQDIQELLDNRNVLPA